MKRLTLSAFGFMSILLLSGCGDTVVDTSDTTDTAVSIADTVEETITIGAIAPLSGDAAAYGVPIQNATNMAIAEINEKGGINGKQISVVWEDGKCNPKDASSAAQKLVNIDKVSIILGGLCSGETLGAAPITEKAEVILFSTASSSPDVTEAGDFVFRNFPSDSIQGKVIAEYANEKEYTTVAMLSEQTDYAVAVSRVFKDGFNGKTNEETFLSTESDFKTRITKIKNSDADVLFLNPQTPAKMEIILKQLAEQQVTLPIIGNEFVSVDDGKYILAQKEFIGDRDVAGASFVAPENDNFTAFITAYEEQFGEISFSNYAATTYDGVYLLTDILAELDDATDTTAIRDALYAMPVYTGISGEMAFDENGDVTQLAHSLFIFNGETFVPAE